MSIFVPEVSAANISQIVHDMDTTGYACVPNYIQEDDLRRMQAFVTAAMIKSNNEYVHFDGPDAVTGSGLEELAGSPRFETLIHAIYEAGTGAPALKESFYQVLRCLCGKSGQKNSLIFHYDSFVVTALIPIYIPAEGKAGDLLMYPNTRRIRSRYLVNAFDKLLLDNPVTQKFLSGCVDRKRLAPLRIRMLPGNLYYFWGYRSIHTNEPCDPDKVRATALFHYCNPHRKRAAQS